MTTVLVTGATGFVGVGVVGRLLREGYAVRALVRPDRCWPFAPHERLERAFGDMRDAASLARAARGADAVVHLAAAKNDDPDSVAINVEGARNLAAAAAGVTCLVNVSTQSVRLPVKGDYASTKEAADRILENSAIPMVTLRPSLVYVDGTSGVLGAVTKAARLPVVPIFGDGSAVFRPIHRDDLAEAILIALRDPTLRGRSYEVGGPDEVSFNELVDRFSGGKPKLHLPVWLGLLAARALSLLPRPPITASNVLGGAQRVPMDVEPFFRDFGLCPHGFMELPIVHACPAYRFEHEAMALLQYVVSALGLRWEPGPEEVGRYVEAVRSRGMDPKAMLDGSILRRPWLLGGLELASRVLCPQGTLQRKLLIAAALMECHPATAEALLPRSRSRLALLARTVGLLAAAGLRVLTATVLLAAPSYVRSHAS